VRLPADYDLRHLDLDLDDLQEAPALAIDGPRGVGKTYTAARRANTILRLDQPEVRRISALDGIYPCSAGSLSHW